MLMNHSARGEPKKAKRQSREVPSTWVHRDDRPPKTPLAYPRLQQHFVPASIAPQTEKGELAVTIPAKAFTCRLDFSVCSARNALCSSSTKALISFSSRFKSSTFAKHKRGPTPNVRAMNEGRVSSKWYMFIDGLPHLTRAGRLV